LAEQRDVVVSQLNLAQAQDDVLEKMSSYYAGAAEDGTNQSMAGMIAALERSVPEITEGTPTDAAKAKPAAAAGGATALARRSGSVQQHSFARRPALFLGAGPRAAQRPAKENPVAPSVGNQVARPIRANLVAIVQNGEQVNGQVAATTDSAQLNGLRQQ